MAKMGFGLMRLPQTDKDDLKSVDQEQVNKMVDEYMEAGFNYFDTGYGYHDGASEVAFRKAAVERYHRDSFTIADKMPIYMITKEEEVEPIFYEQLERCGVEYFDYYLMHNVSGFSEAGFIGVNSFEFVNKMKEEGKIKHLGFSTHANAEYIENIIKQHPEMEFIQLQLNYLDWENESIESRKCYEVASKYGLPVIVMEPLKGGFLVNVPEKAEKLMRDYNGESPVEWALRFVGSLDNVVRVLNGVSDINQMKENISTFKELKPLNDEEKEIISQVVDIINENITVACTKCNYCVSSCPQNINIPKIFDLYNNEMMLGDNDFTPIGNAYVNYTKVEGNGKASDCIECGSCMNLCPQHLDIISYLKDASQKFETAFYGFN